VAETGFYWHKPSHAWLRTGLCCLQASLEAELVRLQRESREKQNVIDEKEEEMYELETRIEKQVSYLHSTDCWLLVLFCRKAAVKSRVETPRHIPKNPSR